MEQSSLDFRTGRVGRVDKIIGYFSFAAGMMHKPPRHSQFEKTYKEKESDVYSTWSLRLFTDLFHLSQQCYCGIRHPKENINCFLEI